MGCLDVKHPVVIDTDLKYKSQEFAPDPLSLEAIPWPF